MLPQLCLSHSCVVVMNKVLITFTNTRHFEKTCSRVNLNEDSQYGMKLTNFLPVFRFFFWETECNRAIITVEH